ncbi:MAG: cation-translocating P-type ATPase, partial [Candidatus Hydrogenedentes bacterium]|nr:cation-translocating P-type ATPase [Candidatus Hydrogenedentota bacterium]
METIDFKIVGLDCAEEVAILKRVLGPVVGGEDRLRFDILNGKLGVSSEADPTVIDTIREAIAGTGMRAIPWAEYLERSQKTGEIPFWERRGRTILCTISGALLSICAVIQGLEHGWLAVLGAHGGDGHGTPAYLIALYTASLLTGVWYVLPKAWYSARSLRPDMNLLMVVAICGAIGIGEWMEAATVAFLFSLALLLETWSVARARRAIESLVDLSPTIARCWCPTDEAFEEKPADEVPVDALVLVRPGETIPLD